MDTTRASLLIRVRNPADSQAWEEFVALYRPLLVRYARARGLDANDAEDVAQHCLAAIAQKISAFRYDRQRGRFRSWLRRIVNNHVSNLLRRHRERLAETHDFERPQQREESPDEAWEKIWLEEHLKYCMKQVRTQLTPHTFEAFHRVAIEGWPVEKVCAALGMSANQVYLAKSRVTRRLRGLMCELVGEQE